MAISGILDFEPARLVVVGPCFYWFEPPVRCTVFGPILILLKGDSGE